jgi:hypothetical protein
MISLSVISESSKTHKALRRHRGSQRDYSAIGFPRFRRNVWTFG